MIYTTQRRFVYDTWDNGSRLGRVMVECRLFMTHCLRLNLQLHTISLVRTCISSFCTVSWQLARLLLTRRIARSLGDSGASCYEMWQHKQLILRQMKDRLRSPVFVRKRCASSDVTTTSPAECFVGIIRRKYALHSQPVSTGIQNIFWLNIINRFVAGVRCSELSAHIGLKVRWRRGTARAHCQLRFCQGLNNCTKKNITGISLQ